MNYIKRNCLKIEIDGLEIYNFTMKVKNIVAMSYVAVRGINDEIGAVQRILNKKRVNEIKNYILEGNTFYNTFFLNWTNKNYSIKYNENEIEIPEISEAAQVIDGQHRLAGFAEAIKEKPEIGEKEIIITLSKSLDTKKAAGIFLNINTEQKPVPKSLIYDLFGLVYEDKNLGLNRANDIAKELNENPESPFYNCIKYPGKSRGVGLLDLSTVISTMKNDLEIDGILYKYNLKSLDVQKTVILNYFSALSDIYSKDWNIKSKNPFFKSYGFGGAFQFFTNKVIEICAKERSFSVERIKKVLNVSSEELILQDDIKHLDGKTAKKRMYDFLESFLLQEVPHQDDYEL